MNFDLGIKVLRPRKLKIFKILFTLEDNDAITNTGTTAEPQTTMV